ncbi:MULTISPECIES: PilW family protein [Pseudoalteromonas]|uniref:PilW family protein n=1 Tax=Pseudoalteromonas haloplanktis TaxID=228 RepID=A0ABU1BBR7_PSEHA|nr:MULTISPECIES: PilW family protein [Pseudoalteromonas]MCF6143607.1 type IV pilus assembly protein PilW [Pseudoalteromonas mariniglutinosa NCIMB 1770]MDQ9091216.1 PilW family protein [Pseudoalteromonas haloplanktis]TMN71355.1 prepilin-type N-terminal cleavage/methylation domain-containing protein [Pseudoalteromonas sp. S1727]BDF93622.1 type IV minor pilin protein PilW [Pseudoalteromonas sp. KAN5]
MKQQGFTLVEMMVALFIGGLVLGGVMFTYISMKVTTRDTMTIGELQETGRLALNIMQRDIEQVGFWGTFYEDSFSQENTDTLPNPAPDCTAGLNNGSFPVFNANSNFRSIYAIESTGGAQLNCIPNAQDDTDILQVKFLEGLQINPADSDTDNYYFIAEQEQAEFRKGPIAAASINGNATVWRYRHHVYYIDKRSYKLNEKNVSVPVLMRRRLAPSGEMIAETIMEGVENMRFLFGLDTNNDSRVDTYRSVNNMTATDWENRRGILTVQVFILVRALQEDADLNQLNQTYTLGEDANQRVLEFNDKFRRALFTTTIRLNNVGANLWRI